MAVMQQRRRRNDGVGFSEMGFCPLRLSTAFSCIRQKTGEGDPGQVFPAIRKARVYSEFLEGR